MTKPSWKCCTTGLVLCQDSNSKHVPPPNLFVPILTRMGSSDVLALRRICAIASTLSESVFFLPMSLVKLMLYGLEDGKPKYQLMKKISKKNEPVSYWGTIRATSGTSSHSKRSLCVQSLGFLYAACEGCWLLIVGAVPTSAMWNSQSARLCCNYVSTSMDCRSQSVANLCRHLHAFAQSQQTSSSFALTACRWVKQICGTKFLGM